MQTIYLIRHAKSSWKDIDKNDLDRPLKKRGVQDIKTMADALKQENVQIELMMTSPAVRSFDTAKILVDTLKVESSKFQVKEKLYLPDFPTLLKSILYLSDDLQTVAIVGHEPSLSSLINYFLIKLMYKVGIGSVTKLVFNSNKWSNINASNLTSAHHKNRHDFKGFALL